MDFLSDELLALAFLAETEPLVGDELVGRETIVQLDHLHVPRSEPGLLVHRLRRALRHSHADEADAAARELAQAGGVVIRFRSGVTKVHYGE